jgi:hypothetical protein
MSEFAEFEHAEELVELRRSNERLQSQLRQAKAKSEALVQATIAGARDALLTMGPVAPVATPPRDGRRKGGEVALWHLTDWQGSKVTTSYNSAVMRERVMRYCVKAGKLTGVQRADHPVREGVVLFGGDMAEGLFNFPTQPFEIDASLFGQLTSTARLCADVVREALALYDRVTVVSEWGNHGRLGSKRAVVPRSDNLDRMIYELARTMLEGEKRLTWEDSAEDVQRIEIGNYRALLIHGDEFGRNGWVAPSTLVANVAKWQSGAYGWEFRDVYLGHLHVHEEFALPNGRGSVYKTGSPESDNRYANVGMASASSPSQRLHFIDPEAGRVSAVYKVWLDG